MDPDPTNPALPTTANPPTSQAEFEAIHGRMRHWLRRWFADRVGDRDQLADDLSQRTWMAVWRAVSQGLYDPRRAALTTFVYAVAQNIFRQHAKTAARARARGSVAPMEEDDHPAGDRDDPGLAELIERVRTALRGGVEIGLSPEEIQVLSLVARGESDRGLAERLGVAPSTANARKRAALGKLRRYLAPNPSQPDAGDPSAGGARSNNSV